MKPLTLQESKKKKCFVWEFPNGDYSYVADGTKHLIRNGKEIVKGDCVLSYDNGDYLYWVDGVGHKFNKDGKEITI